MMDLTVPVVLIVVAIPLILEKIPRNGFYGFRTPYALSSDEVWYRANRISGFSLLAAGLVWLAVAITVPMVTTSQADARRLVNWYGLGTLAIAFTVSFWLTYRRR